MKLFIFQESLHPVDEPQDTLASQIVGTDNFFINWQQMHFSAKGDHPRSIPRKKIRYLKTIFFLKC